MSIRYTDNPDGLKSDDLAGFFIGWPRPPSPERHLQILRNSFRCWLALDGTKCVGFVNALSDGVFYAHIPLLEVLPQYQGQGIGSELVRRMTDSLHTMYAIDVVCDERVVSFYEKLGFRGHFSAIQRNMQNQDATKGCR